MRRVRPRPIFAWSSDLPAATIAPCFQTPPAPTHPYLSQLTPTLPPLPRPLPQPPAPLTPSSCLPSSTPGPHLLPPATHPSMFGPGRSLAPLTPTLPLLPSLQLPALLHLPPPPSLLSTTNFQMPPQIPMPGFGPSLPPTPTLPPAPFTLLRLPPNPISGEDNLYGKVCFPG